ncbi:D-alanyl-D-alanine carboxypeptidase/D-alanyl-D-alanine-endopeptidase [Seohaeicola saemankumensis]|uniref:D-alanyl-D-alanine carboxypeptidase/D-alanyl-D-alanine endopeptidase n=1 Tax=Seohaeicola saemankumensis TaxID=481181 RepID=UPI001E2D7DD8|nr:D-alanyl-D-alanine carboxypeptidase/D-alanyl-D-alanine-endopeptidase [Seohaeicola saemankumensis]MCD1626070.1 D-alanyl-D-alanine carboxypeptidase/D-alanyl-D-alanine-endopeptidase [Seohaeicola saemankumensis]
MNDMFSRRKFLAGSAAAVALFGAPACANAPSQSLRPVVRPAGGRATTAPAIDALIGKAQLGGDVVFAVADAQTGSLLEVRDPQRGLPPASVVKALTAIYALDTLGPAHRFETRLIATGPVQNGILSGDLVLAGGGDPVLDTDGLAEMAASLKAVGIREVRGRFLVWGGALPYARVIDDSQPDHVGYNPAVSGLALNNNRVHFEWKRNGQGYGVTMDARTARYRPDVRMARMSVVARDLPVYTYRDAQGSDEWTVAQSALGNGGARWLPVRRPEVYAGEVFRILAGSQGIRLPAEEVVRNMPGGTAVVRRQSPPLTEILRDMLRYSTNLTAEMVGLATTQVSGAQAGSLAASAAVMNRWANGALGMSSAALVDHSGLGDRSRLAAADMVAALVRARRQGLLPDILRDFPMKDDNGRTVSSHKIKVSAKTGTLNFVSGLAGYMTRENGKPLAFAIFVADVPRRENIPRAERERPAGAQGWNRRAKTLQQNLIERWGVLYST